MRLKLYLETSVISAYFDSRTPERQAQTKRFWPLLKDYEIVTSQVVRDELSRMKDANLKKQALALIEDLQIIQEPQDAKDLAQTYVNRGIFPEKYYDDAYHLAIATLSSCNILVSWNFAHLVKRKTRIEANLVNSSQGYPTIDIIAPPEL
ncbi:MAG: PIN domain-containing protein [Candidatus Heimdallarchaeota archaeon]